MLKIFYVMKDICRPPTQSIRPDFFLLGSIGLGIAVFLGLFPLSCLDPHQIWWHFDNDRLGHMIGWFFWVNEPWSFPLGKIESLIYPAGITVSYTDSIPLLAFLAKPFAELLPFPTQFFGFWLLACFILQSVFSFKLLRALRLSNWASLIGSLFFLLSPVLLGRFQHTALCAHWLILLGLWLYFRDTQLKIFRPQVWVLLHILACLIAVYFMPFTLALTLAAYFGAGKPWSCLPKQLLFQLGVIVAMLWILGYLGNQIILIEGFGEYSSDLLALINPRFDSVYMSLSTSAFFGGWPHGEGQYEGYAYLGAGMISLVLIFIVGGGWKKRPGHELPELLPVSIAALALAVYALSSQITLGGHQVADLSSVYKYLGGICNTFRASGRFIWLLYYLIFSLAIAHTADLFKGFQLNSLLLIALGLQLYDIFPLIQTDYRHRKSVYQPPQSAVLEGLGRDYQTIAIYPPQVNAECPPGRIYGAGDIMAHSLSGLWLAAREKMNINSGTAARVFLNKEKKACEVFLAQIDQAEIDERTVYIPEKGYEAELRRKTEGKLICAQVEGQILCVSPDYKTKLQRYVSRRR